MQVAPNPTKVRLYIAEKNAGGADINLDYQVVKLMKGEQNAPEFLKKNPFGAVPVLEFDDGSTLTESLSIIEYLEECYPNPTMWGDGPRENARAREMERIADLRLLGPVSALIHATNSPVGLPPNEGVASRAKELWPKAMAYFDGLLKDGRSFLNGEKPSVADCTLAAALHFARFAQLDLKLESQYNNVFKWDDNYRKRASVKDVLS